MGGTLRDNIRLTRLRERLQDRPNDVHATVQAARLEYHLGLYNDAERTIARALELGHQDDGSMQVRLARIHLRRYNADTSNYRRDLLAALASFNEALKFTGVAAKAVHYLEVTSVYLKLNETQRAANALGTLIYRWPHSREAALAKETCAQTLLVRGQASDALPYYKALLMDPLAEEKLETNAEHDHAEVDLPNASKVLGSEGIFLQEAIPDVLKNKMGLCYENLGQSTMASKAYREAWKALLEERNHGTAGKPDILNGYGVEANRDETGTMLQQEKSALRVSFSAGQEKRHANKSMPTDDLEKSPSAAPLFGSPERQGVPAEWGKRSLRHVYRMTEKRSLKLKWEAIDLDSLYGISVPQTQGGGTDKPYVPPLRDPYTWYRFGEVLLHGHCYALGLVFFDKAVALLPPGLEQQEKEKHLPVYMRRRKELGVAPLKVPENFGLAQLHIFRAEAFFQLGRFSDAYSAAVEARNLDPVGKKIRILCSRLMALHSEEAGSQYSRESLATLRIQRVWRGHRMLRRTRDFAKKQIAAMRIQRFMREWRKCNRGLVFRLITAGSIEFSRMQEKYELGMGSIAKAAAAKRKEVLMKAALSFQGVCRVYIARYTISKRRKAIATLQAFYRGCRGRLVVSTALEEWCCHICGSCDGSGADHSCEDLKGYPRLCTSEGGNLARSGYEPNQKESALQVGILTRCNVPMDMGYSEGFSAPNLAAFLWEPAEESNGSDVENISAAHSETGSVFPAEPIHRGGVFEISASAVISGYHNGKEKPVQGVISEENCGRSLTNQNMQQYLELCFSPISQWVPLVIAPERSLARALQCSTLIVNSPSFDSMFARRLFSRIERPAIPAWGASGPKTAKVYEKVRVDTIDVASQRGNAKMKPPPHLLGHSLAHIMMLGESPIGNGGLSELSSAMRQGGLPLLVTLAIGGPGCRVGPRGVTALAEALSSPGCYHLYSLSISNCCRGRQNRKLRSKHSISRSPSSNETASAGHATCAGWHCFFRHLQRLKMLSLLSLQSCGLKNCDARSLSVALQILPAGQLRCLRLSDNSIGIPGLQMLLRALISRRMRLPALWLRRQQPALAESEARDVIADALNEGLFMEAEFEQPLKAMGGRSQIVLLERTAESEDLGIRARKNTTSKLYI